ncbi:P-loop NTPase family protein [Caldovatus aquaticus]|uniref:Uncharacterized protein n=1 Tax=Caldovatus aquaticus TaxID=2865671 RepID=A0ABS7F6M9_9PROT|nr:hypothetical protein [Caldovatus aquaticus]MBW8271278.1 hypothetical protein [Caldovatus aquaticus]
MEQPMENAPSLAGVRRDREVGPAAERRGPALPAAERPVLPLREFRPVVVMSVVAPAECFRLRKEVGPILGKLRNAFERVGGVVVHLTAAERGDGASTLARELAVAAASLASCRVLLLDCGTAEEDRGGTLGRPLPDVVSSFLRCGQAEVALVTVSGASFHAAMLRPSFEPGGLSEDGRSLGELYHGLRRAYDLLIVDCPPILEAPYLVRIAQETPQVVLVVQAEKTRIPSAMRARDEIALAGANLVGVVLNKRRPYLPRFLDRRL